MQLHQLRPIHKSKKRKRVGRGGKRGTYSGRGIKGQKARAGARIRPELRDMIKKIPKLRGIKFKATRQKAQIVNTSILEEKFSPGDIVSPLALLKKRLVRKIKGRPPQVKLLGAGDISKKLLVKDCQISKGAREKIEKAGGTIK